MFKSPRVSCVHLTAGGQPGGLKGELSACLLTCKYASRALKLMDYKESVHAERTRKTRTNRNRSRVKV